MLNIQRFVCNMFQENCYVVSDDTSECVIIDCGAFFNEEKRAISEYVKNNSLSPKHLLCTHGHVFNEYGLKPEVCQADEPLMKKLAAQAKAFTGVDCADEFPPIGKFLSDGGKVSFGSHVFSVISTPGHTPGSAFLYCKEENLAFSGDTLFQMSIGRTDLELGDYDAIVASLRHIAVALPADTMILPGHGGRTTMKDETAYNPYFRI